MDEKSELKNYIHCEIVESTCLCDRKELKGQICPGTVKKSSPSRGRYARKTGIHPLGVRERACKSGLNKPKVRIHPLSGRESRAEP